MVPVREGSTQVLCQIWQGAWMGPCWIFPYFWPGSWTESAPGLTIIWYHSGAGSTWFWTLFGTVPGRIGAGACITIIWQFLATWAPVLRQIRLGSVLVSAAIWLSDLSNTFAHFLWFLDANPESANHWPRFEKNNKSISVFTWLESNSLIVS